MVLPKCPLVNDCSQCLGICCRKIPTNYTPTEVKGAQEGLLHCSEVCRQGVVTQ